MNLPPSGSPWGEAANKVTSKESVSSEKWTSRLRASLMHSRTNIVVPAMEINPAESLNIVKNLSIEGQILRGPQWPGRKVVAPEI
jgi:hypothetical protein